MRILFTSRPAFGHVHPLIPLARAAATAGHDVAFATGEPIRGTVERLGFAAFEAGLSVPQWRQELAKLGGDRVDRSQYRPFFFGRVFPDLEVPPRLADLRLIVDRWQPEILIHGVAEFAGPLAASLAGISHATCGYGPLLQPEIAEIAAVAVARYWEAEGFEPAAAEMYRSVYLDPCPPGLQIAAAAAIPARHLIRPEPAEYVDDRTAPGWLAELPSQPTVYFTLGTIFNRDLDIIHKVLDGLAHGPVNVIATVGPDLEPHLVGSYPANIRLHRYIPQAQVLGLCDLVICHAGAGSIFGALGFALPVLMLPRGADNFYNADRVVAAGAGRVLLDGEITPLAVEREVTSLLGDERARGAANRLAAEIAAMPAPTEVIETLEALVTDSRRSAPIAHRIPASGRPLDDIPAADI